MPLCFRHILGFLLLTLSLSAFAQKKGVKPVAGSTTDSAKKTEQEIPPVPTSRALIIGISEYSDEKIPDLQYAHIDAEEMVNFLKSEGGGALEEENIHFLSDKEATVASIYSSLDWLLEESLPMDKVFIYFSGHGDVETKRRFQQGFFLAHDTPATNYLIGSLRVEDLNSYLETMALENKSKVVVITDACRSGHLAGGEEGVKTTAENMADLLANEIKIMSCKPEQLSLEGKQWGGGRGVFSYHLLDGLGGLADTNGDKTVDLSEIDNYLKENVVLETDSSQIPNSVGLAEAQLFNVDDAILEKLKKKRKSNFLSASLFLKGSVEDVLAKADSATQQIYSDFIAAIDSGYLLPIDLDSTRIGGQSADELYSILVEKPELKPLFFKMKQQLVVALQDDTQRALNAYLNADPNELEERWTNYGNGYKKYPAYLQRAADLLGESHRLYPQLLSKKLYFEGVILRLEGQRSGIDSLFLKALEKEEAGLKLDTNAAYIYNEMGLIYDQIMNAEEDTAKVSELNSLQIEMYEEAMEITPKWAMPYNNLGSVFNDIKDWNKAEVQLKKAIELRPNLHSAHFHLGVVFNKKNKTEDAVKSFRRAIELRPNDSESYVNLGNIHLQNDDFSSALKMFLKAQEVNSTNVIALKSLAGVYFGLDSMNQAKSNYEAFLRLDTTSRTAYSNLAIVYLIEGNLEKAEFNLFKAIALDSKPAEPYYNLACIYSLQNQIQKSIRQLEQAIIHGFDDFETIKLDTDLSNTRKSVEYSSLIYKYFINKKN